MIDVLKKLEDIAQTKPELVADAVANVQKTNPAEVKEENDLIAGKEIKTENPLLALGVASAATGAGTAIGNRVADKIGLDASRKGNNAKADPNLIKKDEGGMSDIHIGAQEVVGEYLDDADGDLKGTKQEVLRAMAAEKDKSPFPKSYEIETAMQIVAKDFDDNGSRKNEIDGPDDVPHDVDTQMNMDAPAEEPKIQEEHTPMGTRMFFDMGAKLDINFDMDQKGMMAGVLNALDQEALATAVDTYKKQNLDPDQAESKDLDAPVVTKTVLNTEAMTKEDKKPVNESKKPVKEAVQISTDSPEEASMMMQILKLAGVQPVDQDMINQEPGQEPEAPTENPAHGEEGHECGCDTANDDDATGSNEMGKMRDMISQNDGGEQAEETFANEPDEKVSDVDTLVNVHSGGLNKQKQQVRKEYPGDNPLAVKYETAEDKISEEDLSNSLRNQYEGFKKEYQEAAKATEAKAKPDFLDMDKDGNKKEPMKKAIADKK